MRLSYARTYHVIYSHIVVDVRPQKEYLIRVRITVGGNHIEYQGKVMTKTADLTMFKLHVNSAVLTRGARYTGWDIGNFYLETPME